ncbi:MAG: hypothetical protein PHE47_09020 [Oscillospiraceae bacterium]|nr:hypothetical protein [Oscillospiraceae bacterium]
MLDKPEAVIIHIEDFYPESPESGQLVTLEFGCFTTIARDFVLEENRQEKQKERHHDKSHMELIEQSGSHALVTSVEEEHLQQELRYIMQDARTMLTTVQERRVRMFIEDGLSSSEIGRREGVSYKVIGRSIKAGLGEIKKFWKHGSKTAVFCRIK